MIRALALTAGLALLGCGDALIDGRYVGDPQLELPIRVAAGPFRSASMRVTLLWSPGSHDVLPGGWTEHGPLFEPLPGEDGVLRLFEPPPIGAAVGRLVLYDAPDGRWTPDLAPLAIGDAVIVYDPEAGYHARPADSACCPDQPLDCITACQDVCAPRVALLIVEPDPVSEATCD